MPSLATDAKALIPRLRRCGYSDAQIATPFKVDQTDIDVVAFAGKPWDNWSACLAAVDLDGDPKASAAKARSLGATSVFVCGQQRIDWWGLGAHGPTSSKPIRWADVDAFFRDRKPELAPRAIYDAKLRRPGAKPAQMTFFDVGLMPAVEKDRGETLLQLVRNSIDRIESDLSGRIQTDQDWEHVYRAVFWLLTAKILNDKDVPNFKTADLSNVKDVYERIGRHHGVTESLPPFGVKGLRSIEGVADTLKICGSLRDVSSESIAYLYEHALIDKAAKEDHRGSATPLSVRKRRGIHGTPSVLRDHMLSQLWPLIEEMNPSERHVFEPACGHAPFLTGIMRWLREWDDEGEPTTNHDYLRDRLCGLDDYAFARELAKLNLTIADAGHKNSWTIDDGDMFAPGVLRRHTKNTQILLSNPPYESFGRVGAPRYSNTGEPVTSETQGVEMLKRTLPHLPPGGVFGVVMPVGVLHDKESKPVRMELLKNFDLSEISVFADNLFEHGDHEVAVLMGRRKKPRSKPPVMMYRRVREAGMAAFKERLAFSWERVVSPNRFVPHEDAILWLPELEEVWAYLTDYAKLEDLATVGQGLSFHGKELPKNAWTIKSFHAGQGVAGFAKVDPALTVYSTPTPVSMNLARNVVRRRHSGAATGIPQVLLNYHPVSRDPWRLKPFIDRTGHAVTSSFLAIRPRDSFFPLEVVWALLNSPIANAFVYCFLHKRNILSGKLKHLPVPILDSATSEAVRGGVQQYIALARARHGLTRNRNTGGLFDPPSIPVASRVQLTDLHSALLKIDAAVLRAYDLPPRLERQLLDLFTGAERKGVGLDDADGRSTFRGYYPPGFTSALPLHMVISERFEEAAADKTAERFRASESEYVREVLDAASVGTGED